MFRLALFIFCGIFVSELVVGQQLPPNECGIVCTYDAAGNRLKRVYFCNNGSDPYPMRTERKDIQQDGSKNMEEYQRVDALYPNPTTGKFFVTFSRELKNAKVLLTDINGKVIQQFIGNGYKLNFDLSSVASGVYLVRIEDGKNIITKKVVKQ